jgi:hypothetical protein
MACSLRLVAAAGVVVAIAASSAFGRADSPVAVDDGRLASARLAVQRGLETVLRCARAINGCLDATRPSHGPGDAVSITREAAAPVPDPSRAGEAEPPSRNAAWLAWQQLEQARAMLRQAQDDRARASSSPAARELLRAQQDVSQAQSDATRVRLDLERLNGPDPTRLAAASRAVERAEATLRALRAESASRGDNSVDATPESAVASAQRALQDAIAQRDQILAGPSFQEIEVARKADGAAHQALEVAARRLALARQGARPLSIAEADAVVVTAQIAVYDAEYRFRAFASDRR